MYHKSTYHTQKWDFSQPVTLTQSAKVPGNAGHRSAPHESPQDWLGPQSEVVARVDVESQGGLPVANMGAKGSQRKVEYQLGDMMWIYGKTTKLEVVDSFSFSKKCLVAGSKLLHLPKNNGCTKKHDGLEEGIFFLTMGIADVHGSFLGCGHFCLHQSGTLSLPATKRVATAAIASVFPMSSLVTSPPNIAT